MTTVAYRRATEQQRKATVGRPPLHERINRLVEAHNGLHRSVKAAFTGVDRDIDLAREAAIAEAHDEDRILYRRLAERIDFLTLLLVRAGIAEQGEVHRLLTDPVYPEQALRRPYSVRRDEWDGDSPDVYWGDPATWDPEG